MFTRTLSSDITKSFHFSEAVFTVNEKALFIAFLLQGDTIGTISYIVDVKPTPEHEGRRCGWALSGWQHGERISSKLVPYACI